jgi:type II secretory pathway pseudopilin PulG
MEIITLLLGFLGIIMGIMYLILSFLLPFYVRRTMKATEALQAKSARIDALEQIQRAQLAALNELIKIQWEIKNQ